VKILLLDSDFDLQQEIQEKLYYQGHRVECVETLDEAEDALHNGEFDIMIADYKLQVVDHLSQVPRLYNDYPNIDIVLTSDGHQSHIPHEVMVVSVDCFEKPFPVNMLENIIHALEDQRRISLAA